MKGIENYLIILIVVGDMGEKATETIRRLWSQKNERQFCAAEQRFCDFADRNLNSSDQLIQSSSSESS
jgi:hypothetical protein